MNKTLITFIIALVFTIPILAQKQIWTLEQCLQIGVENNYDIKIKLLEVEKLKKQRHSYLSSIVPVIQSNFNHSYNFGSTIDPATNSRVSSNIQYDNININSRFEIFDLQSIRENQLLKLNAEIAGNDFEINKLMYQLEITEMYFKTLSTQELLKIQYKQFENTEFNFDRISKEVALGNKPTSDLFDIQLLKSTEENKITATKHLFQTEISSLFNFLNIQNFNSEIINLDASFQYFQLLPEKIATTPSIKKAELEVLKTKKNIESLKSINFPKLTAYHNLSSFYFQSLNTNPINTSNFKNQLLDNKENQVGFSLNIPIFNGSTLYNKIAATKIENEQSQLELENEKLRHQQEIEREKLVLKQLEIELENHLSTLIIANNSYNTTQSKFQNGIVDTQIFAMVKNNLLAMQYQLIQLQLNIEFQKIKLQLLQ